MNNGSREASNWMSLSDMMTGLMIVFLFIAIAFMKQQVNQTQKFKEYALLQNELYDDLQGALKVIEEVELKPDLSIVISESDFTFKSGASTLENEFKLMLDEFYKAYLKVLLKEKYRPFIKEVRIEGHTDSERYKGGESKNPFISNVELSQDRARHVLEYLWDTPDFKDVNQKDKKTLEYWFTANGLSYGRMVDKRGRLVYRIGEAHSKLVPDNTASRRVEFRIITNAANLIDEYNKKM
jgi:outer membrane protein OmpA-like peptidoglycan-associated protein